MEELQTTEEKVSITAKEIADLAKELEGKSFAVKDILNAYREKKGMFESLSEDAETKLSAR